MHFVIELEAIDAPRNCRRRYRVEAGQDLLGDWMVTITFGRIGARGRSISYVAADEQAVRRITRSCLRKRASAPRRFGVAYVERDGAGSLSWSDVPADRAIDPT